MLLLRCTSLYEYTREHNHAHQRSFGSVITFVKELNRWRLGGFRPIRRPHTLTFRRHLRVFQRLFQSPFFSDLPGFQVTRDSIFPSQLERSPIFISATVLMFSVSFIIFTYTVETVYPNHSNLLLLVTIAISSTFTSSKISSFIPCSCKLTLSHCPLGPMGLRLALSRPNLWWQINTAN